MFYYTHKVKIQINPHSPPSPVKSANAPPSPLCMNPQPHPLCMNPLGGGGVQ